MDFGTLIAGKDTDGSIKNWIANDTIPSVSILEEAESWIYRRLRMREMLTIQTGTMTIGDEIITPATNYLGPRLLNFTGTFKAEVKQVLETDVEAGFSYDGNGTRVQAKPTMFYPRGDPVVLQLEHEADLAYTWRLLYYAKPLTLDDTNSTNFLTTKSPRLIRATCMAYANEFMKDQGETQRWLVLADHELNTLNAESDMEMWNADIEVRNE